MRAAASRDIVFPEVLHRLEPKIGRTDVRLLNIDRLRGLVVTYPETWIRRLFLVDYEVGMLMGACGGLGREMESATALPSVEEEGKQGERSAELRHHIGFDGKRRKEKREKQQTWTRLTGEVCI